MVECNLNYDKISRMTREALFVMLDHCEAKCLRYFSCPNVTAADDRLKQLDGEVEE